jgi:hypothetical protein
MALVSELLGQMCTSQKSTMPPIGTAMMMNKASTCAALSTNSLLAAAHGPAPASPSRNIETDDAQRPKGLDRCARRPDAPRTSVGNLLG